MRTRRGTAVTSRPDPPKVLLGYGGSEPSRRALDRVTSFMPNASVTYQCRSPRFTAILGSSSSPKVALPADLQHRAQHGDGVVRPLLVDQLEGPHGRSVSRARWIVREVSVDLDSITVGRLRTEKAPSAPALRVCGLEVMTRVGLRMRARPPHRTSALGSGTITPARNRGHESQGTWGERR